MYVQYVLYINYTVIILGSARSIYSTRVVHLNTVKQKSSCSRWFHGSGASTFSERGVQLSTTDNFCRKNGKCCTIKYCISFLRILDFSDVVLNSTTFSIFSAKIPVVLNCTHRQKRAYAKLPWNHLEHEDTKWSFKVRYPGPVPPRIRTPAATPWPWHGHPRIES